MAPGCTPAGGSNLLSLLSVYELWSALSAPPSSSSQLNPPAELLRSLRRVCKALEQEANKVARAISLRGKDLPEVCARGCCPSYQI